MSSLPVRLDPAFIDRQQQKLLAERANLSSATGRNDDEDRSIQSASDGQANESEDRAQDSTISENNRLLIATLAERRLAIDRALAKIDEGTYGVSDISGDSIARDRLEAFPAAICTTDEEADQTARLRRMPAS